MRFFNSWPSKWKAKLAGDISKAMTNKFYKPAWKKNPKEKDRLDEFIKGWKTDTPDGQESGK